jgi:uncharacterized tellurite resistance protein B-like protein
MLIVWGFRTRLKTIAQGLFHCPKCGVDRQYMHREMRRWFTLFWIPLIPTKKMGTLVECGTCHSKYEERVLQLPTSAAISDSLQLATRALVVRVVLADGLANEAERSLAVRILQASVDPSYSAAHLETDLVQLAGYDLQGPLAGLTATLNDHGKERLLSAAIELANVDGNIDDRELAIVREAGGALAMTPNHVRGIIQDVLERTS